MTYKARTIKRVYAERIGAGLKSYEISRFNTAYRGTVAITISGEKIAYCLAELTDVVPSASILDLPADERAYGEFAWKLENVRLCEPVPCKGQLGLWNWIGDLPRPLPLLQNCAQLSFNTSSPITTWFEGDTLYLAVEGDFEYKAILSLRRQIRSQCLGIKDIEIEGCAFAIRFRRAAVIETVRAQLTEMAQQFLAFYTAQPIQKRLGL